MAPDTKQNLIHALYLTFFHNWFAVGALVGLAIYSIAGLMKPSRSAILGMLGCGLLLFAFQYNKHIKDALYTQTRDSLITMRPSLRIERVLHVSLVKVLPLALDTSGALLLAGSFLAASASKKEQAANTGKSSQVSNNSQSVSQP
jgi:hypothetical protein